MSISPNDDVRFMQEAIRCARQARRLSPPNPSVGAVIVKDGHIVARGFTQQAGGPHAEIMALREAFEKGIAVDGATVYVTLEPCSHFGRTPPCANALIASRIGRVVVAVLDPNPLVSGQGVERLKAAGIAVTVGVCEQEAWWMNRGFLTRMQSHRPWVRLKVAATLDGKTALPDGRSSWITGEVAREDNQYWRGEAGAIVTGIGTVLADDPRMNVRLADQKRFPLKVVVDTHLRTPLNAKLLEDGQTLIVAAHDPENRAEALRQRGAEVLFMPATLAPDEGKRVDLVKMVSLLAEREVNEVHLEAGASLNGAFLTENLVDEILLYTAPCFFGEGRSIATLPIPETPGSAHRWTVKDFTQIGTDLRTLLKKD